jgi:hypothetical protein
VSAVTVLEIGPVTLTRVLYTDAVVPADAVGLTLDEALAVPWCDERWATGDGVRVAAAAWVVTSGERVVVLDPFRNADDILHDPETAEVHRTAIAEACARAGVPVGTVTDVFLSHVEGLGMVAVRDGDGWAPFFPDARIVVGEPSMRVLDEAPGHWTTDVLARLVTSGAAVVVADGAELAPGVVVEHTGAHGPDHHVVHVGPGPDVTFVGHLAVSPLHLSTGVCEPQHDDPGRALERLLAYAADGRLLIGPLWPSPGAGRFAGGRFEPVS